MCGRYGAFSPPDLMADWFAAEIVDDPPPPSWNVAPTDPAPVVLDRGEGRELRTLKWGLIPSWAKDPSIGNRMINARMETVADKPAFRSAVRTGRILVPATGFYEWAGEKGAKVPYAIRVRGAAIDPYLDGGQVLGQEAAQVIAQPRRTEPLKRLARAPTDRYVAALECDQGRVDQGTGQRRHVRGRPDPRKIRFVEPHRSAPPFHFYHTQVGAYVSLLIK